jgi:hypothetical protein
MKLLRESKKIDLEQVDSDPDQMEEIQENSEKSAENSILAQSQLMEEENGSVFSQGKNLKKDSIRIVKKNVVVPYPSTKKSKKFIKRRVSKKLSKKLLDKSDNENSDYQRSISSQEANDQNMDISLEGELQSFDQDNQIDVDSLKKNEDLRKGSLLDLGALDLSKRSKHPKKESDVSLEDLKDMVILDENEEKFAEAGLALTELAKA